MCNTCKINVSMGSATAKTKNTSNLWTHLRINHVELFNNAEKERESSQTPTLLQPKIKDLFQKHTKWQNSNERSQLLDRAITEMMVTDNQPFTMVSDSGFKRLMSIVEPRYTLKNEKFYRTEMLPKIHHKVVQKVKTMLQPEDAGNSLSFTTDCWSGSTESLMSLTCHFIDNGWTKRQLVLNTKVMQGSHTGEYIKEMFLGMLDDWGITKDRVMLVLRDSGANMVKGMKLAEVSDLSCMAHTLQLVVNDGLSSQRAVIDIAYAMLKKCASHFHHSFIAKHRLRCIQSDLGLPQNSLIQAVPTRWNSTLHMLQRMLEQKRALCIYAGEHGGYSCPNADQWEIVANLIQTLLPIEEVTLEVSHNDSSVSSVIPCVRVLKMLLQENEGPTTRGIKTLREVMKESLNKRFLKYEENINVVLACLLDPRFKHHAFSSDNVLSKAKEWLTEDMQKEVDDATETYKFPKRKHMEKRLKHGQIDAMFSVLLGPHVEDSLTIPKICLDDELHLYLKEPVINRKDNPLEWWKENEARFKTLASYARRYLCSPPSSVPSERVFSEVSAIYERNRSRLTGEHAEMLCFLHYNVLLLNWKY
ncbi:LOW QUALITY PROTEIN: zinc finger BED domain-containing protein 4-like [Bufo bufo]|uniref:LOW QUALITY PROTEIN: zinc finger BED domain-containing protein 4-like n=1 Tax=Bufo bufo TaxID=8384 RepID=UPI001ABECFA4|nr:LOW QUALITY PROTEIN: zinc finger BED domain-containing protein 4-like [Bufo bufo]